MRGVGLAMVNFSWPAVVFVANAVAPLFAIMSTAELDSAPGKLSVYFDGGCPVCRAEISSYQGSPGGDSICWLDVTKVSADELGPGLMPEAAIARFHVRRPDGELVSGAAAFVEVWGHLDNWRWLAALARIPGMLYVMEKSYLLFLRVRPLWRR